MYINSPNINALFHPEIKFALAKIAQEHQIEIKIHFTADPEIHLFGSIGAIESARIQVLVALDQLVILFNFLLLLLLHITNIVIIGWSYH